LFFKHFLEFTPIVRIIYLSFHRPPSLKLQSFLAKISFLTRARISMFGVNEYLLRFLSKKTTFLRSKCYFFINLLLILRLWFFFLFLLISSSFNILLFCTRFHSLVIKFYWALLLPEPNEAWCRSFEPDLLILKITSWLSI
jgi:hypothetical protein